MIYYVALPFAHVDGGLAPGQAVILKTFGDVPDDFHCAYHGAP
jgi:hypothetical protein